MVIRNANDGDLTDIVTIANALLATTTIEWTDEPHSIEDRREWLFRHRAAGDPVLVAEHAGRVVGFAAYGDFRDAKKWPGYRFTVEHTIHVDQRWWGAGVGRALMEALIDRARDAGKHVMVGAIDGENGASIRFHERLGFVEVARMPEVGFKLGQWLSLILMQRSLAAAGASGRLVRS